MSDHKFCLFDVTRKMFTSNRIQIMKFTMFVQGPDHQIYHGPSQNDKICMHINGVGRGTHVSYFFLSLHHIIMSDNIDNIRHMNIQ